MLRWFIFIAIVLIIDFYAFQSVKTVTKNKIIMKHMWSQFEKLKIRQSGQLELPFSFDEKGHTIEPPIPIDESKLSDFNKKLKTGLDWNPKN